MAVILGTALAAAATPAGTAGAAADWFRDAVFYEVFVRSFNDSNGDGVGDLNGLTAKLDYLNDGDPATGTDLGVTALWLMPISPSPSYHGYDVTDYYGVNPDYGTMADFKRLVGGGPQARHPCHHRPRPEPHLQPASLVHRRRRRSPARSTTGTSGKKAPSGWSQPWTSGSTPITSGTPCGPATYYYGLFYDGMPDLNYRNPAVQEEMIAVGKHWLSAGADGFRLDAVRYLFESGPGAGQQDIPETHAYLARYCQAMKQTKPDSYLVGEIWTDMDTVATYLGSPRELDSAFNFDLSGAIVGGVKDKSFAYINATQEVTLETYPKGTADAIFLTNHDQDRVASQVGPDPARLKLAASVLLTLPGTPIHLLRRGDRHARHQARREYPQAHALERRGKCRLLHGETLERPGPRPPRDQRQGRGGGCGFAAQPLPAPDPPASRPRRPAPRRLPVRPPGQ